MQYDVKEMQEACTVQYMNNYMKCTMYVVKECKIFINLYTKNFYSNCALNAQA
jgi:hypothetical protein